MSAGTLMRLGGFPVVDAVADAAGVVTEAHLAMLDKLLPYPVAIQTDRFDLLAYNRTDRYLIDDVEKWPAYERNCALLVFLDPQWRERYLDFEKVAASVVARLRASMVAHAGDPEWARLVERPRSESPRFERHWQRHDVALGDRSERRFRNDRVGLLRVNFTGLWLDAARSVRSAHRWCPLMSRPPRACATWTRRSRRRRPCWPGPWPREGC